MEPTLSQDSPLPAASGIAALRAALAARLRDEGLTLPLMPRVATQLLSMARDSDCDAGKLSRLIHQDAALAGQVLRIANSPAYLPRTPIVSLQQAVTRLGFSALIEIAVAASLQSGTFRVPGHEEELRLLWQHSLASGAWAKEVARAKRNNVESAFLCGLLHAVGKPTVLQTLADVAKNHSARFTRGEAMELLDELHTLVGSRIAAHWSLPRQVSDSIAHYATYREDGVRAAEPMITCLADRLATALVWPDGFDDAALRDHPVFADLNLYPEDVDALLAKRDAVETFVRSMSL
jgi:HD-like signal output (HDOD) protein